MLKLLKRELTLNNLPVIYIMPLLTVLVCIPYYPASISMGYGLLGLFLLLNYGQTNRDIEYMSTMPIARKDIVKSKIILAAFLEIIQLVLGGICGAIRIFANFAGGFSAMAAPNLGFFGFMMISYAVFNIIFFARYFVSGGKTGLAAIFAFIGFIVCMALIEVAGAFAPFKFTGKEGLTWRLLVFVLGVIIYCVGIVATYFIGVKKFEKANL